MNTKLTTAICAAMTAIALPETAEKKPETTSGVAAQILRNVVSEEPQSAASKCSSKSHPAGVGNSALRRWTPTTKAARREISGLAMERAALITATRPAILARSESFGRRVGFACNIRRILASTSCVRLR
jgi:hypothetical protein